MPRSKSAKGAKQQPKKEEKKETTQVNPEPEPEKKETTQVVKPEPEKKEDNADKIQTKPTKQPKKYVKKSIEALQRIERSKHDRIFLLKAERNEENWSFTVLGTKGSQYNVHISVTVKCSCIDFRMKQKPCKHIFFIVTQVAQNEEILDYFKNSSTKLSKNAYKVLDDQLANRLRSRMNPDKKDKKDIDLKDDTDCTICFTEMDKDQEDLEDCGTCKKYFHVQCITAWKNHNPTCPLCRSAFAYKGPDTDPLGRVTTIKL